MNKPIEKIAVVGAGQMGSGIAQVFASNGFQVGLFDAEANAAKSAIARIQISLDKLLEKTKITAEQRESTIKNLNTPATLNSLSDADLVIEAIVENFDAKRTLFSELDKVCKSTTIFASNTSSISITKLASCTTRPTLFVGMHFMNPVPVMKLVEVIRGIQTSEETYQLALLLCQSIKKTTVTASKDYPGFIVNRILIPMINEAFFALMEGVATAEEIDTAMKLGTNQPMGPFELADFVGLDTVYAICKIFHSELGEDKYRPCPLLTKYVEAGWNGRKSGRGVYQY